MKLSPSLTNPTNPTNPFLGIDEFAAYEKHGLRLSQVLYATFNYFTIPEELQSVFSFYHQGDWSIQKFTESLANGAIYLDGIPFILIYRRSASRAKILKRERVSLSFRQTLPSYGSIACVLVS